MKNFKNVILSRFFVKLLVLISFGCLLAHSCQKKSADDESEVGTFDNAEEAFAFTKQTLDFISKECNTGMKNATYRVNEYEQVKSKIFKNKNHEEINRP
jgi:hypothetical protein